jgi:dTDP-4-dehydrorhamnose 3,5-epimerase-like enzyme
MYNIGLNQVRGCHAHRTLQQVLICINGKCSIALDDAHSREVLVLSRGDQGIYIGPYIWHEIYNCTNNTIILALASDYYDESDYIRDYKEFLNFVSSNKEGSL